MSTYVGLTPAAKAWLLRYGIDLEKGQCDKGVSFDRYVMSETDDGKPIYGHVFHLPALSGQKKRTAIELKQIKIKGMICTDLFVVEQYDNGRERSIPHCCSWIRDLFLKDHDIIIHYDSGRFCDV